MRLSVNKLKAGNKLFDAILDICDYMASDEELEAIINAVTDDNIQYKYYKLQLNSLERTMYLQSKIREYAKFKKIPVYKICNKIGLSTTFFQQMNKHKIGKRKESQIIDFFNSVGFKV